MYDDVESDFWKEIFVHLQHKNMVRTDGSRLCVSDCQYEFNKFKLSHPELRVDFTVNEASASFEAFVTPFIKLRLFVQSQIKASLLQKQGQDFVKIADAKFPYNPFPEISELISRRDFYEREVENLKEEDSKASRKSSLAGEFIKAYVKFKNLKKNLPWKLEAKDSGFILKINSSSGLEKKEIGLELDEENFKEKIDSCEVFC